MQPSGLIFLVIIAIWAAYLLQHWVVRREHLATARSVDRFSEAMHVLERRAPRTQSSRSASQPRSYVVSPVRPCRPEVVVTPVHQPRPGISTRPGTQASGPTRGRVSGGLARRLRGLSLLISLVLVVAISSLAAFAVLPWWSAPVAVAVLVADFAWLRRAAAVRRRGRRTGGRSTTPTRRSAPASARSGSRPARSSAVRSHSRPAAGFSAQSERLIAAATVATPATVLAPTVTPASVPAVNDGDGVAAADLDEVPPVAVAAQAPAEVDPSAWAPVPVPPPTYTLKARAERPAQVPAPTPAPARGAPSSFDGVVDEGELDGLLDRRRAAGA